jgi:hypothetical protein
MKKTIAALAVAASLTTAAQASWFNPNMNCMSIEDMYRLAGFPPDTPIPHTLTEMIADMRRMGLNYVDVTDMVPNRIYYGPGNIRTLKTDDPRAGANTYAMWVDNQATCFNMQAQLAGIHAGTPLPFAPQSVPTQPAQSDPYQLDPYRKTHHQ